MDTDSGTGLRGRRPMRATAPRRLTQKRLDAFLSHLSTTCNVRLSAAKAKVDRSLLYKRRDTDAEFEAAWQRALSQAYEQLEMAALERGIHGVKKKLFHGGKQVGEVIEYDPRTALALLKMHRDSVKGPAADRWTPDDDLRNTAELEAQLALIRERLVGEPDVDADEASGTGA